MKKFLHHVLRRNAYLLLAAAWLFTIAIIINGYWSNFSSARYLKNSIEKYIQRQERDFESFSKQTSLLQKLSKGAYSVKELEKITSKQYGIFLYDTDRYGLITLKFWSSQEAAPTEEILHSNTRNGFVRLPNGQYEFLYKSIDLNNGKKQVIIALIPVYKQYFIQNSRLRKEFINHPMAEESVFITQQPGLYPVKSSNGNTLFYLQPKPVYKVDSHNWISLFFTIVGIAFIMLFINNLALFISRRFGRIKGIIFSVVL